MGAALLERQPAAEEVGGVRHRAAPADGLPVDDRQRARAAGLAEEQVVEAVVAVHEALGSPPVLEPGVEV